MNSGDTRALRRFADGLFFSAALSLALIAAIFLSLPFLADALGGWPFLWPVFAFNFFAALGLTLYILFDALLFRMISTYNDLESGLKAVDAFLRRTGLREQPAQTPPLAARMAGTRRLQWVQRGALLVFAALFVSMAAL
jgi:hypothetical protein